MDTFFDTDALTLDKAAELVAARVQLHKPRQEKVAAFDVSSLSAEAMKGISDWYNSLTPDVQAAIIGGGLGTGAGLLTSARRKGKDKQWLYNALLGGGLGAGIGFGGRSLYDSLKGGTPETNANFASADELRNELQSLLTEIDNPQASPAPRKLTPISTHNPTIAQPPAPVPKIDISMKKTMPDATLQIPEAPTAITGTPAPATVGGPPANLQPVSSPFPWIDPGKLTPEQQARLNVLKKKFDASGVDPLDLGLTGQTADNAATEETKNKLYSLISPYVDDAKKYVDKNVQAAKEGLPTVAADAGIGAVTGLAGGTGLGAGGGYLAGTVYDRFINDWKTGDKPSKLSPKQVYDIITKTPASQLKTLGPQNETIAKSLHQQSTRFPHKTVVNPGGPKIHEPYNPGTSFNTGWYGPMPYQPNRYIPRSNYAATAHARGAHPLSGAAMPQSFIDAVQEKFPQYKKVPNNIGRRNATLAGARSGARIGGASGTIMGVLWPFLFPETVPPATGPNP